MYRHHSIHSVLPLAHFIVRGGHVYCRYFAIDPWCAVGVPSANKYTVFRCFLLLPPFLHIFNPSSEMSTLQGSAHPFPQRNAKNWSRGSPPIANVSFLQYQHPRVFNDGNEILSEKDSICRDSNHQPLGLPGVCSTERTPGARAACKAVISPPSVLGFYTTAGAVCDIPEEFMYLQNRSGSLVCLCCLPPVNSSSRCSRGDE